MLQYCGIDEFRPARCSASALGGLNHDAATLFKRLHYRLLVAISSLLYLIYWRRSAASALIDIRQGSARVSRYLGKRVWPHRISIVYVIKCDKYYFCVPVWAGIVTPASWLSCGARGNVVSERASDIGGTHRGAAGSF